VSNTINRSSQCLPLSLDRIGSTAVLAQLIRIVPTRLWQILVIFLATPIFTSLTMFSFSSSSYCWSYLLQPTGCYSVFGVLGFGLIDFILPHLSTCDAFLNSQRAETNHSNRLHDTGLRPHCFPRNHLPRSLNLPHSNRRALRILRTVFVLPLDERIHR
jgi:hypothetical protein